MNLDDIEPVCWHEPGSPHNEPVYNNVTGHKKWALINGWQPLYPASALAALRAEVEQLTVQLAGCGVAALGNAESSKEHRAKRGDYGYSESYAEVCRAVDREIELRAQLEAARADAARMREAVEDAAYEWAKYVEVDTAPRTLLEHMRNALDAARAALEGTK